MVSTRHSKLQKDPEPSPEQQAAAAESDDDTPPEEVGAAASKVQTALHCAAFSSPAR